MTIDLDMGDGTPKHLVVRAFARPRPDAVLRWDYQAPDSSGPNIYSPYLIRITEYAEFENVTFFGVDLKTAEDIAGEPHRVLLGDSQVVIPGSPSTLRGWTRETSYGVLFLSSRYRRIEELKAAQGRGKVPKGLADPLARLRRFSEELTGEAKVAFDATFAEYLKGE